jgi:hypothetical protein
MTCRYTTKVACRTSSGKSKRRNCRFAAAITESAERMARCTYFGTKSIGSANEFPLHLWADLLLDLPEHVRGVHSRVTVPQAVPGVGSQALPVRAAWMASMALRP